MIARDLIDSGSLDALAGQFDLLFTGTDDKLAKQVSDYGEVVAHHSNSRPRQWLWNSVYTAQLLAKYRPLVGPNNQEFFNRKSSAKSYWHWTTRLGVAIHEARLGVPFATLGKTVLRKTAGKRVTGVTVEGLAGVLLPTVLRDFLAEDLVRWARRRGVPTVGLQGNWDCFNLKQMLAAPDHFLVWGEQSWYFARILQEMPHASLHVIGSQRHDAYFRNPPERAAARKHLGLDPNAPTVLFCGVIGAFDELALLKDLEAAVDRGDLPRDLVVLYKPHPRTTIHRAGEEFAAPGFRHVRLIGFGGRNNWNTLEYYPILLRAVDAVLSPYSTMGLEAALCGRPALCLGFHSDAGLPYWRYALEFLHVQAYRFAPWAIPCNRREDLIPSVWRLLEMAADPGTEARAMEATRHIVYRDETPFPERLTRTMKEILADRLSAVGDRNGRRKATAEHEAPVGVT